MHKGHRSFNDLQTLASNFHFTVGVLLVSFKCLCIVADHMSQFMTMMHLSSYGHFQQDNTLCHKQKTVPDQFMGHSKWVFCINMTSRVTWMQSHRHAVEKEIQILGVQPSNVELQNDMSNNIDPNFERVILEHCWIYSKTRYNLVLKDYK